MDHPGLGVVERVSPEGSPVGCWLAVHQLGGGYSPREIAIDEGHLEALAEVLDRLPPVVVARDGLRVIDGLHRVEAFRRAGRSHIRAFMFDGSPTDALALAVRSNSCHGKPLSRRERQVAAGELLRRSPERSDRWVGEVCGLSHSTVARLRCALDATGPAVRLGRDGRRRPVPVPSARVPTTAATPLREAEPNDSPSRGGPRRSFSPSGPLDGDLGLPGLGVDRQVLDLLAKTELSAEGAYLVAARAKGPWRSAISEECTRRADAWARLALALSDRAGPAAERPLQAGPGR